MLPHVSFKQTLRDDKRRDDPQSLSHVDLNLLPIPHSDSKRRHGSCIFFLLIFSLISLYLNRLPSSASHWDSVSIAFAITMASPIFSIFLSQVYHGQFSASPFDLASRFLLCIPIFLALRQTNYRVLEILQLSIPMGALVTYFVLHFYGSEWGSGRYTTGIAFKLIHFGDIALMLGFLSLFSINLSRADSPLILIFKFSGFLAGLYMSIQSGERGGWIASPALLLLWAASYSKKYFWLKLAITTLVIGCAALMSYF